MIEQSYLDNFPDYAVTSDGRVFSKTPSRRHSRSSGWRENRGWISSQGYRAFSLKSTDGRKVTMTAHRLVALAFIGDLPRTKYVCHENGDKLDNRVENLRIDTPLSNALDRDQHGSEIRGGRVLSSKVTREQAIEIYTRRHSGESRAALADEYGMSYGGVRSIDEGKSWGWLTSKLSR